MTRKPLLIPVLLLCMLFNGNLFTLLVAAKTCNLLPFALLADQSETAPATEVELDAETDVEDPVELCCFYLPVLVLQILAAQSLPFTGSSSHDLIYILHNLRV